MTMNIEETDIIGNHVEELKQLVEQSRRVAIVCHMTPDGDAAGSSLCLWHTLMAMGKEALVVIPDALPDDLHFLPGADRMIVASYKRGKAEAALCGADLIFCLDFNEPARIDRLAELLGKATAKRIMIDHHLNPMDGFCNVTVSQPESSSTCLLLYKVLERCGWDKYIGLFAAECCTAGMMTDTGNFSYNANDPEIYRVLACLMAKGVNKDRLYKSLFDTNTVRKLRVMGYAQYRMQVMPEHRCAVITLGPDECKEFDYHKGDTESLVNRPLSVPGIVWSVYLRESEPGYVKVSMRSKGAFSVRDICAENFGGGGHVNAAGGEVNGTLAEAYSKLLDIMPMYDRMLPSDSEELSQTII